MTASDARRARRSWLPGALLAAVLPTLPSTTGCSFGASAIAEAPVWLNHPSGDIAESYRRNLVANSRRKGEPYERGRPAIDAQHGRVFVGSSDRGCYALRAQDGEALWRFETLGAVQSEPVYDAAEDAVYFGSNDGALYKVRAGDGQLIWRFSSNAEVARAPEFDGERLYFVNANDTVVALNRITGERLWSQHRTPALGMEIAGHAGLMLESGRVFVAFSDGTVTAYDADTGQERWEPVDLTAEAEQQIGTEPKYLDVDTTPVGMRVGGLPAIAVASYESGVTALSADSGGLLWNNPGVLGATDLSLWEQPAHTSPSPYVGEPDRRYPERRVLIVNTGTSGLWGLDPESGEELWRQALPDGGINRPAFIAGAMLVTTSRQGIYLISPLDGAVIDGIHTQLGFAMSPATHQQRAFVLANSGQFLALSVAGPR